MWSRRPLRAARGLINLADQQLRRMQLWAHSVHPENALLSLKLESASKRNIPNEQNHQPMAPATARLQRANSQQQFGAHLIEVTRMPTGVYNCHGLIFASRRTNILGNDVRAILNDDKYKKRLTQADVRPGDVVLFVAPDGDIEHSAIVLVPPSPQNAGIPTVYGKWGQFIEYAHPANLSEYRVDNLEYYRVEWL